MIPENLVPVLAEAALEAGFEPAAILAIADVESGGRLFVRVRGRNEPVIRFEGHYFDRRLSGAKRTAARAAGLAHPDAGKVVNPASQAARWAMLDRAAEIDAKAARESCSWGLGQVMGGHWAWLGYSSVDTLVDEARSGAAGQLRLMLRYIDKAGLASAIRRRDWRSFARGYNGPGFARARYHVRIAKAYQRYAKRQLPGDRRPARPSAILRIGMSGPVVADLQRALSALGYPVAADGIFGTRTRLAVKAFQRDHGLVSDGLAGPLTMGAIAGVLPLPRVASRLWLAIGNFLSVAFGWLRRSVSG